MLDDANFGVLESEKVSKIALRIIKQKRSLEFPYFKTRPLRKSFKNFKT